MAPYRALLLVVDKTKAPRVRGAGSPLGDVSIYDPDGEFIGGAMVWLNDGYLSGLEIWWTDEPSARFRRASNWSSNRRRPAQPERPRDSLCPLLAGALAQVDLRERLGGPRPSAWPSGI